MLDGAPERGAGLLPHLGRGALAIAVPQAVGMALSFALGLTLARWLGAADFGAYSYLLSWVGVLSLAGAFGTDALVARAVPAHAARGEWDVLRGTVRWATEVALLAAAAVAAMAVAAVALAGPGTGAGVRPWIVVAPLVVAMALARVQQATLRGLHWPSASQLPDTVVQPLVVLLVVAALRWGTGAAGTATVALAVQAVAAAVALGVGAWLAHRALRGAVPPAAWAAPARRDGRASLAPAARLFALGALGALVARIDVLLLGALAGEAAVGPYAAALRGAAFVPIALNVATVAMAPTLSRLHATGEHARMRLLVRRMTQLALAGGVPVAVALAVWGRDFLLLFGPGFDRARPALAILCIGQVANVAAGPVATVLVATGNEREAVIGIGAAVGAMTGAGLLLIPRYGATGAAAAAALGLIVWNGLLRWFVRRRLAPAAHAVAA